MASASAAAPFGGRDIQNVVDCNRRLEELGITSTVNLPQIVALGDQSTGKSSLITALSGIHLPRSVKRCTQCPIKINISGAVPVGTPWCCRVSIIQAYWYDESYDEVATPTNPFGRWQELPASDRKTIEFAETDSPEKVGRLIKAAQCAILNPQISPQEFIPQDDATPLDESTTVNFSPNTVRLDIMQSGWPSLSFTDLPGVFASAQNPKDKPYKQLVDNLATKYAANPATIILLTLPMSSGLVNSKCRDLLHDVEGAAKRTFAVLTKPDCALKNDLDDYFEIIRAADEYEFELGYHVVRLSDAITSQEDALKIEDTFFSREEWVALDATHPNRLGVEALRSSLQQTLFTRTQQALPDSLKPIDLGVKRIDQRLQQIFVAPPHADFLVKLETFCKRFHILIKQKFYADNGEKDVCVRHQWDELSRQFREGILDQHPHFMMRSITDGTLRNPDALDDKMLYTLDRLRNLCGGDSTDTAYFKMTRRSIQAWNDVLEHMKSSTSELITKAVMREVEKVVCRYGHLGVYNAVLEFMENYLHQTIEREFAFATKMLQNEQMLPRTPDTERTTPWTLDKAGFKAKIGIATEKLQKKRVDVRVAKMQADIDDPDISTRAKVATPKLLRPPEDFAMEIKLAAGAQAYYEIAAFRFTDSVGLSMRTSLLDQLITDLPKKLKEFLTINDPNTSEKLAEFMKEDPKVTEERAKIEQAKTNLGLGRQLIIEALGGGPGPFESSKHENPITQNRSIPDNTFSASPTNVSKKTDNAIPSRFRVVTSSAHDSFAANQETPPRKRSRDTFDESNSPEPPVSSTKKQRLVTEMMARQSLSGETPSPTANTENGPRKSITDSPNKKVPRSGGKSTSNNIVNLVDNTPTRISNSSSSNPIDLLGPSYDDSDSSSD